MTCPLECTVGLLERRLGRPPNHGEVRKECAIFAFAGYIPKDIDCPYCLPSFDHDRDRDDSPLLTIEDGSDLKNALKAVKVPDMVVV